MSNLTIETPRLLLRTWQADDIAAFAAINADPRVMEYMPKCLTLEESAQFLQRIKIHFETHGFGVWATVLKETNTLIGFIGLTRPAFQTNFTPCVEIGWRLASDYWNRGLATEGAKEVINHAFQQIKLNELVSYTVPHNRRSRRVMEKLGMTYAMGEDFNHPYLPAEHPLSHHVLYRLPCPH